MFLPHITKPTDTQTNKDISNKSEDVAEAFHEDHIKTPGNYRLITLNTRDGHSTSECIIRETTLLPIMSFSC